jgi:enolase
MSRSRIIGVTGRQIWDSRGRPTVEAEVSVACGVSGRAIAPAGASRGSHEAVDLRDGGSRFGGFGVDSAVSHVNGDIASALVGHDAADQRGIDSTLAALDGTANKSRLGGNAVVAVSMATLHAAARAAHVPVWQYVAGDGPVRIPMPEIQIFGGGAHAGRRTDIQDYMIMTPRAESFREALATTAEVYRAAGERMSATGRLAGVADEGGWWPHFQTNEEALEELVRAIEQAGYRPGEDVWISLDIAANEFGRDGRYRLALDDREIGADAMIELIEGWVGRFPILSIEDPLAEDDFDGAARLMARIGQRVQIIGDDLLVTNANRVRAAAEAAAVNALLVKVNQAGTVTEAKAAYDAARAAGWATIVSARSGESEDVTIAHLAVGWDAGQFKVGSFARSERMAKWNEMLRIEEAMGEQACFAGADALPVPVRHRLGHRT